MKVIGIIPARMASSRFPGKPLCKIAGLTMVEHVYRRSSLSRVLSELYVATCDTEVKEAVRGFGSRVIMTSPNHQRCTERVAEAAQNIQTDAQIIVIIQGDEPMVSPTMIDAVVEPLLRDPQIVCANLVTRITPPLDANDPNVVKVVKDLEGFALYFSREPIPSDKKSQLSEPRYRQTGIISFRRDFLYQFVQMEATPLEVIESVDMMRLLEHGYRVKLVETSELLYGVDTEEDRKKVEKILEHENLSHKRVILPI